MSLKSFERRLDRLETKIFPGSLISVEEVTADDLFSGACFKSSRNWLLEDLIAASQEINQEKQLQSEVM